DMSDDLRADIESAIESAEAPQGAPEASQGAPEAPQGAPEAPAGDVGTSEAPPVGEAPPRGDGRTRDVRGRFSRSEPTPAPPLAPVLGQDVAQATVQAANAAAQAANAAAIRAPQSLNATEREHWSSAPREIQDAFVRREREVNQVLQQSAGARQFTEAMTEVVNPYLGMIQSAGANPFEFISGMLQAASVLRGGTAAEKATFLAHIIHQHGVSVEMLDQALVGQAPQSPQTGGFDPTEVTRIVQQQMAPVQRFFNQIEQQRSANLQRLQAETTSEMDAFAADPKNEFFNDVRGLMANLTEQAARENIDLSFKDAYEAACLLHPSVKGATLARQRTNVAQEQHIRAQKAKAASASLTGNPGGGSSMDVSDGSLRGDLVAAMNLHS
ncbi:MAG: hypothetical protein ACREVG_19320, partial [Burkholderiales bacterium]